MKWKEITIGDFIGLGTPKPVAATREGPFRLEPIDVLTRKKIPLLKFPLIDGFGNVRGCNSLDYSKKAFQEYIKDAHLGYVPPLCQVNQPPWKLWSDFYDDDVELLFTQINEDIT